MKVTVDANILFSAVIMKGNTRMIWFNLGLELYSPIFIFDEFQKYRNYLFEKSKLNTEEFLSVSNKIFSRTTFVSDENLKPFMPAAASLVSDEKDWLYVACALKEDTAIWSNDKGFKNQRRIKVYTTTEMIKEFGLL